MSSVIYDFVSMSCRRITWEDDILPVPREDVIVEIDMKEGRWGKRHHHKMRVNANELKATLTDMLERLSFYELREAERRDDQDYCAGLDATTQHLVSGYGLTR